MKSSYSFSSLKQILKTLAVTLAFFALGTRAFANSMDAPLWNYNLCNGYYKITINYDNIGCGTCDDDWLRSAELYYKNTSGSWVQFWSYGGSLSYFQGSVGGGYDLRSDVHGFDVTLYDRPGDMKYPLEFKMSYVWANHQGGSDHDDSGDYYSPVQYYQTIEKPTGLIATTDECGQISLSWDNPFQTWETTSGCSTPSYYNAIYRNGVYYTWVAANVNSYVDNSVSNNTNYTYKVQQVLQLPYFNIGSVFSSTATGSTQAAPPQPVNFTASDDKCDGSIELKWEWNSTNPQDFLLRRSTSLNGVYSTLATISVNDRIYVDTGLPRGTTYYYKLCARNTCNTESGSSAANGISPADPALATGLGIVVDNTLHTMTITWTDNATNESEYKIERQDEDGNLISFSSSANATSFVDNNVATCKVYTYAVRVFSDCVPAGLLSATTVNGILAPPNLSNTFTSSKKLVGSKGYFNNRVELTWTTNNTSVLNTVRIYRKQAASTADSVQITSLPVSTGMFVDMTADAGVFYKYTIVAVTDCNGSELQSNASEDIGFRSPTGIINGHIQYTGAVAVKDVRVALEKTTGNSGYSATFNGSGYQSATSTTALSPSAAVSLEAWVRLSDTLTTRFVAGKANSYVMRYDASTKRMLFSVVNAAGTATTTASSQTVTIRKDTYYHFSGVYAGSKVKMFVNGFPVDSVTGPATINVNANALTIGGNGGTNFSGQMDEVRVWNVARTNAEVLRDYERILNGDETGLIALYHADEGYGSALYDISKTGVVFNANHTTLSGSGFGFSSSLIPSASQMGYVGYTDALGDYTITGIRYNGNGENFKVTPGLNIHSFTPTNKILYIGDGSAVHNGVDFLDESSFAFSGLVHYDASGCTCPATGAFVNIDGSVVVKNGLPVQVNDSGIFRIEVPIGEHFVSLSQTGHIFSMGRYPMTGTNANPGKHNFMERHDLVDFEDSTYVKMIGKVVGGLREGNKAMIPGRSVNNIGQANIKLGTPLISSPCYTYTMTTVDTSGDYVAFLPPLKYEIEDLNLTNTSSPNVATFNNSIFKNNNLVDISVIPPVQKIVDTLFTNAGHTAWSSIDSVEYQYIRSWVYRTAPDIWVKDGLGRDFAQYAGDTIYLYRNPVTETTDTLPITPTSLGYPVFSQHKGYIFDLGAKEIYHDLARATVDSVPVTTGLFTINNALAVNPITQIQIDTAHISLDLDTAYAHYQFFAGDPNTAYSAGNPNNFLQQLSINFASGPNSVNWLPMPGNQPYKGLLVGGRSSDGQGFVSVGPQVPEMILRDPPGTESFASLEQGSATTTSSEWSLEESGELSLQKRIALGTKFTLGLGVQTPTEISNELNINAKVEAKISQEGALEQTITTTNAWETSSSIVGNMGDIYMGRAMNLNFGVADNICIIPTSACTLSGVDCRPETINVGGVSYSAARRKSLAVAPTGYATSFFYTQDHIVNKLIPRLKELRNQLFVAKPNMYVPVITDINDPNYGRNNDDPAFGTWTQGCTNCPSSADPVSTEPKDTTGLSYTFHAPAAITTLTVQATDGTVKSVHIPGSMMDSIRWYNQQIRLWEEAVAMNEKEKYEALNDPTTLIQNYSYSGGVSFSRSLASEKTETTTSKFEVAVSTEFVLKIGAEVGGSGVDVEQGLTLGVTKSGSKSDATLNTTTFGFTLSDPDVGDVYSVDVRKSRKGFGNIFNITAGESSCPWEGPVKSLYYKNGGQYVTLSGGTLRREKVEMKVDGSPVFSQKVNIPSTGSAVYDLEIFNITETNDDIDYAMTVIGTTNPNGAIVTIDGNMPSDQLYSVPAGSSIHKQLVVQRGSTAFNYDSIGVVVMSACGDGAVGDTVYVTAHFLPSCTDVNISSPLDQWVVNNSFHDTLNLIIDGYDINYNGLKELEFEFKPSSQASWIGMQTWYKDLQSPGPDSLLIPQNTSYAFYRWGLNSLPDGSYDIRSTSTCLFAGKQSAVLKGVVDRINPSPFGTPSPGDGILDPNDDIAIQFNEPVDQGTINFFNFDVRGVLNNSPSKQSTSVYFDGVKDYAEITGGVNLQKRDFSIEFWAKRGALGEQAVISQGIDPGQSLFVGFNASNKFAFRLANKEVAADALVSTVDGLWHHYAVAYSFGSQSAYLFVDGNLVNNLSTAIAFNYTGSGKLLFAKENHSSSKFYNGNLQGIRFWNKKRSASDNQSQMNLTLNKTTSGLLYDWRMDEAEGTNVEDFIRSRNATLHGGTWQVDPVGYSAPFDASAQDKIVVPAGQLGITTEMDFTLEFWFNSSQSSAATLFSNGKGDGVGTDSLTSWNIARDANGKIHVYHYGMDFVAADSNYFDGQWHHFALVMQRSGNLTSYVDGILNKSTSAGPYKEVGGAEMYLGARGYKVGPTTTYDNYFTGKIDEFRFWNLSRKAEQIKRDKLYRLRGDESGLIAFLPFELYTLVQNVPTLTASFDVFSADTSIHSATVSSGAIVLNNMSPTIKLPRITQSVPINYSVNSDKIIITPAIAQNLIENVTLDVTVKGVRDQHGNYQQSPKTWIAYINKNQVKWQDDLLEFEIEEGQGLSFDADMLNTGGLLKQYTISNLPSWMTVNAPVGTISPNSAQQMHFVISPAVNIGTYEEDILLTTDFGFAERLTVRVKVKATEPNLPFDPSQFQYSMDIIGQLKIDGVLSSAEGDKLIAYINDSIRGIGTLTYLPAYDRYEVFMSVYHDTILPDSVRFSIWNSLNGEMYQKVTPTLAFNEGGLVGTPSNPVTFSANTLILHSVALKNGWTWVSFPVNSSAFSNSNKMFANITPANNDQSWSQSAYDVYDTTAGWIGSLTATGGYDMESGYKINHTGIDTLKVEGAVKMPDIIPISVDSGWNWIGYIALKNATVGNAMGNYNALEGDILKGQFSFAYYDSIMGWLGSLTHMVPGEGYMLFASDTSTFTYPVTGITGRSSNVIVPSDVNRAVTDEIRPENFRKNMSVIVHSNLCNELMNLHSVLLKVYSGNQLRGVAAPVWVEAQKRYLFFLTIYSNSENDEMIFTFADVNNGNIFAAEKSILFSDNRMIGTPNAPLEINVAESKTCFGIDSPVNNGSAVGFEVYPNPFAGAFSIRFTQATDAIIKMVDPVGREVYSRQVSKATHVDITPDAKLANGIYFVKVISGGETRTYKISKNN